MHHVNILTHILKSLDTNKCGDMYEWVKQFDDDLDYLSEKSSQLHRELSTREQAIKVAMLNDTSSELLPLLKRSVMSTANSDICLFQRPQLHAVFE